MSRAALWAADGGDATLLRARVTPKGGRDAVEGLGEDAEGRAHLRLRASAPPADGAANAALVKLLAKTLRLPRSAIALESGATARVKLFRIAAPLAYVRDALGLAAPDVPDAQD